MTESTKVNQSQLSLRAVGDISGRFFVPAYQRGYRWGEDEVDKLLDDIWEAGNARLAGTVGAAKNYCLQPVVVKAMPAPDDRIELIDGQQRLTTLYLILHFIKRECLERIPLPYSLEYQTRPRSAEYLANVVEEAQGENVDFAHIWCAYSRIAQWFGKFGARKYQTAADFYSLLFNLVQVIWFEAPEEVDSTTMFTRLNVGRIALTNSELIKALLLARSGARTPGIIGSRQIEIAAQWDSIERDLRDQKYWAFLTNRPESAYPCRIDLVFELLAHGRTKTGGSFQTFDFVRLEIEERSGKIASGDPAKPPGDCTSDAGESVWQDVLGLCAQLREWFESHDHYHRVGYLVTVGKNGSKDAHGVLAELVSASRELTKSAFSRLLDDRISARVNASFQDVREWSYEKSSENRRLYEILLLFNVESARRLQNGDERYPFNIHKVQNWTLEHIHAQNTEKLNREDQWRTWLTEHRAALQGLPNLPQDTKERLCIEIDRGLGSLTENRFREISSAVVQVFQSVDGDDSQTIANLALLESKQNSAFNNSVFEVKRRRMIETDRRGGFLPIATRRVFLKYYTTADSQQLHFWGLQDRQDYLTEIEKVLGCYLKPDQQGGR